MTATRTVYSALRSRATMAAHPTAVRDIFCVIGLWADAMEVRGLSPETIRNYCDAVLRAGRLRRKDPRGFDPDDVVAVLKLYNPHGPAKGNLATALKAFYAFAEARELCGNPASEVRVAPREEGTAPSLELVQIRALLRAAFAQDPRHGWAIAFLYATGGRIGSVCAVTAADLTALAVTFRVMKGRRGPHEVPLNRLSRTAARHLVELPGLRPTLIGVGKAALRVWVKDAAREAGVELDGRLVWPHLLRHTAATVGYEATKDPLGVAQFLGHKDLRQIPRYAGRADPRKTRVAEAVGL